MKRTWIYWSWIYFPVGPAYLFASYYGWEELWLLVFVTTISLLVTYERHIRALQNQVDSLTSAANGNQQTLQGIR